MSPARASDKPLRKVTLNLYEEDCVALDRLIGWGWSSMVRLWIHDRVQAITGNAKPITLGDLPDA